MGEVQTDYEKPGSRPQAWRAAVAEAEGRGETVTGYGDCWALTDARTGLRWGYRVTLWVAR